MLGEIIKLEPTKVIAASVLADAIHALDGEHKFALSGQRSAHLRIHNASGSTCFMSVTTKRDASVFMFANRTM
jgi:hypothetical protein